MKRNWWYRFIFLILATVISVVVILPTALNFNEEGNYPVKSKINLGLDLQGGLYMILGIDFRKVYKDDVTSYARRLKYALEQDEVASELGDIDASVDAFDPKISLVVKDSATVELAKAKLHEFYQGRLRITGESATSLQIALTKVEKIEIDKKSVSKSIEVIRNRIDEFGVTEPEIISQGNDRIIVQLPGVKDIERAKELIGKTAKLTFNMVNDTVPFATVQGWVEKATKAGIVYKDGERFSIYIQKLNDFLVKDIPKDHVIAFEKTLSRVDNKVERMTPYLVESVTKLTGEMLQDARVQFSQQNEPKVGLVFKTAGGKIFETLTGENIGRRMAIILDGNVYSAPNINEKIGGGRAEISMGGGSVSSKIKDASDLSLVLRAGALPVQLDFLEQRTVGPSLGADSIEKARLASLIGCALVFIFIVAYYKISGSIAMVTLALNILFVLACLVGLDATLTLPGIAGIALTIGMAVDANIIIYERIREEVRKGASHYKSVEKGFEQAFWTIIDANITTALAGICLLNFGTGPIRGFAVTLLIGIFATVYTSYFVGKLLFEFYMDKVEGQDLSI